MNDWTNPISWLPGLLIFVGWLLFGAMRPVRDFYIVQRLYFGRMDDGSRGARVGAHFEGFADYLAAKAFFDQQETVYISVTDGGGATEAEHSVIVVPSRSKKAAITRAGSNRRGDIHILHQTPLADISRRRRAWVELLKLQAENEVDRRAEAAGN